MARTKEHPAQTLEQRESPRATGRLTDRAVLPPLDAETPHPAPSPASSGEFQWPYHEDLIHRAAETFSALADPSRARIVAALLVRELSVNELAEVAHLTQSATSHHLRLLRDRRLVKFHRHGHQIYYSIDDVHVGAMFEEAFRHIRHIAEQLPDHPYNLGSFPR